MPTVITAVASSSWGQNHDAIIVHNGFAGPIGPPVAPANTSLFVASGDGGTISMIDNVIYPDTAALVIVPTAVAIGNATASSSPVVIDNLVLYQAFAKPVFVPPAVATPPSIGWMQTFPMVKLPAPRVDVWTQFTGQLSAAVPLGGQATASSSPIIIDNLVLYPAMSRGPISPPPTTQTINDGWLQSFPSFFLPLLRSVEWVTSVSFQPEETISSGWYQPFPDAPRTQRSVAAEWSSTFAASQQAASFGWYSQFGGARSVVNVSSMIGTFTMGQPIVTNVLPPNIGNWYIQFPIPPAQGAINVAALLSGYVTSIILPPPSPIAILPSGGGGHRKPKKQSGHRIYAWNQLTRAEMVILLAALEDD